MRLLALLIFTVVVNPAFAQLQPAECADIPLLYQFFKKNHVASRDPELAVKVISSDAFFGGMNQEFVKKLDPMRLVLTEADTQDLLSDLPKVIAHKVLTEKNCSGFEAVVARYTTALEQVQKDITVFLAEPDLKERVLEASKKFDSLSREQLAELRKRNDKLSKDATELKQRQFDVLVGLYMTYKYALKDVASDIDEDAFSVAKKALKRLLFREKETTVAEQMMKAAYAGADAHSEYMTGKELEDLKNMMSTSFVGAGLGIIEGGHGIYINKVIEGGAAEENGVLQTKDLITKVNGLETANMDAKAFRDQTVGEAGTKLKFEFLRDGKTQEVTLVRKQVVASRENIKTDIYTVGDKKIGYVQLKSYSYDDAATGMRKAMEKMKGIDGWILDLRGNGGGLLPMAVDVSAIFLGPEELVLWALNTRNPGFQPIPTRPNRFLKVYNQPMTVLVSQFSASASEITAGALQLHGRALIVGNSETSFRKGTIQGVGALKEDRLPIAGGSRLTVGFFYDINGEPFQNRGVKTDIQIPTNEPVEGEPEESFNEAKLDHALPTPSSLKINPRIIEMHNKERAPMQALAQKLAPKFGKDFVKSQEGKEDIVLEAGKNIVADMIQEEAELAKNDEKLKGFDRRKKAN